MDAGALAVLPRPRGIGHPAHEATAKELVQTVKLMSEVKVVRRWSRARRDAPARRPAEMGFAREPAKVRIVVIGASTGGPPALQNSSIVHGMPGEAIRLDAAMLVLPPEKIAAVLANLANNGGRTGSDR